MVATRLSLLSLAAFSSAMFGAFRGSPRTGRIHKRLEPTQAASSTDVTGSSAQTISLGSWDLPSSTPKSQPMSLDTEASASATSYSGPGLFITSGVTTTAEALLPENLPDEATIPAAQETSHVPVPPAKPSQPHSNGTYPFIPGGVITTAPATPQDMSYLHTIPTVTESSEQPASSHNTFADPWSNNTPPLPTMTRPLDDLPLDDVDGSVTIADDSDEATDTPSQTTDSISWGEWELLPKGTGPLGMPGVTWCDDQELRTATKVQIVYTSTTIWLGDPADYTPPYPSISTPAPCSTYEVKSDPVDKWTLVTSFRCNATGTFTQYQTCEYMEDYQYGSRGPGRNGGPTDEESTETTRHMATPVINRPGPTTTLYYTDKNPTVVFASVTDLPDYGGGGTDDIGLGGWGEETPQGQRELSRTDGVAVSLRPGTVILNGETFTDSPVMPTQVVVVGSETFTIDPWVVIGAGNTLVRPRSSGVAVERIPVSSSSIGSVPFILGPDRIIIDDNTFSFSGPPTTTIVDDRTVSIGSSGVAIIDGTGTIRVTATPRQTDVVVAGGEVVTAVGRSVVVIRGTTLTYGPSAEPTTTVVNGEEVTIGSWGVTVRGTTFGGSAAGGDGETRHEVVGGATITQIAPSVVVISGSTFTIGPGGSPTTVVVGGQTVTLGPSGVSVSTATVPYPFDGNVVSATTLYPGATPAAAANPTGGSDEDAAAGLRSHGVLTVLILCIATGVLVWWV